jgi:hypothetical protein
MYQKHRMKPHGLTEICPEEGRRRALDLAQESQMDVKEKTPSSA